MIKRGAVQVIPEALMQWRRERKLTQAELAKLAGVSAALIGHAESGARNLSTRSVDRIAAALLIPTSAIAHVNDEQVA